MTAEAVNESYWSVEAKAKRDRSIKIDKTDCLFSNVQRRLSRKDISEVNTELKRRKFIQSKDRADKWKKAKPKLSIDKRR